MIRRPIIAAVLALALVTMACGVNVRVPVTEVKTGATITDQLRVELPASSADTDLTLSFGAGEIELSPGADNAVLVGTATYNVSDFKPTIKENGSRVEVAQGDLNIKGIPNFRQSVKNEWDLKLGAAPMNLTINAGAYNGAFELGGLSLKSLEIKDGASEVKVRFSTPNLVEMGTFRYSTGASDVELRGLGNANFSNFYFTSGAGSYTLDFSGGIQRDMVVTIQSGVSNMEIIVPSGVNAEVNMSSGLTNIDVDGNWIKSGSSYLHSGSGPTIRFNVQMAAGNIELTTH